MTGALGPLLQTFFAVHLRTHRRATADTVAAYRDTFRLILTFLRETTHTEPSKLRLDDLDAPTILAFLDHLERDRGNSIRTRNARLAALRSFFRFAALREPESLALITRVLAIPTKSADRRLVGYLQREEIDAILAVPDRTQRLGRRDHALLLTLYNTGARVSEIASLRRSRVILGANPFVQLHGKGRKEREVPLWAKTAGVLQSWFRELDEPADSPVFPNARGRQLTRDGISYILQQAVQSASARCPSLSTKRVSPHVLRHTTAMHLLQAGVAIEVIAMWLGHATTETTHAYVEADLTMKEAALKKLEPAGAPAGRFKPDDGLMTFLSKL